jgi:hypothetical protein
MLVYKVFESDNKFFYETTEVNELHALVDLIAYRVVECPLTGTLELMRL